LARRNNPERLGAPQPDPPTTPETTHNQGQEIDPLSFIVPTEFVSLPTKGLYYPVGHPLHGEEAVEIKYMTAKEEDLLSSKSLLEKGLVIDRLIENLLVNKKIRSRDLFLADRDAILVTARASGYGREYKTRLACRECSHTDLYEYDLSTAMIKDPPTPELLEANDVVETTTGNFTVTIPSSPVDITFRFLTAHDERTMLDLSQKRKKKKMSDHMITDQLNLMIVSVMGHTARDTIQQFVETLPLRDSRFLRGVYENICPAIQLKKEFVCNQCDYEDDVRFPFTTDFFWPDTRI